MSLQPASSAELYSSPEQRQSEATQGAAVTTRKKRIRNWTAEDRAAHRVLERSRREAFKDRLTNLAALIPALESTEPSRLSKHVVLDESIVLHTQQRDRIKALEAERDRLLGEINELRVARDSISNMNISEANNKRSSLDELPQSTMQLPGSEWTQLPSGGMDNSPLAIPPPAADHTFMPTRILPVDHPKMRQDSSWESPGLSIGADTRLASQPGVAPSIQPSWDIDPRFLSHHPHSRTPSQDGFSYQAGHMQQSVPMYYSQDYGV